MSLVKFSNSTNPYRYNRFYNDDLFNEFFNWGNQLSKVNHNTPAVNVKEDENGFLLELAIPGLKKKDIKIELNNEVLTISSEKESKTEDKEANYSRQEFCYQSFSRSFTLPDSVNSKDIKANHENGILTLSIPKKEEAKPLPKMEIAIS